jgi:hypothetical protein
VREFIHYTFDSVFVIINKSGFSSSNYGFLVQVINGLGSFQLDFSFIALCSILIVSFKVFTL